jgi:D-alanyl-D-alanine carboxypeptidase
MIVHHENDNGVVSSDAVGVQRFGGPSLAPNDAFQIASVTKPYTATVALQLHEEGVLDLDGSVAEWLDDDIVAQLLVFNGQSFGDWVTIRHLINHTSGLADRDSRFADEALEHPDRVWRPEDLVWWTIENTPPLFKPGEGGSYADHGYVLLGMIAEAATGTPLHDLCEQRIYGPLCLTRTWLHGKQNPLAPVAHSYLGNLDSDALDASVDWGAGGIISTAAEVVRFGQALVRGELVGSPETARLLFEPGQPFAEPLERLTTNVFLQSGFWGSYLLMNRSSGDVICATVNQALLTDHDKNDLKQSLLARVR